MSHTDTITDMATKASLPVTVSGMNLFGVPLPDIVQIATIVYVILLGINQAYTLYKRIKDKDEPKE